MRAGTLDLILFQERPSMSRVKKRKGGSKMKVGETASRVVVQVDHTGQGRDERAHTRPFHLLRGLDSAWSLVLIPHRESGTRWWAAADVGVPGTAAGTVHGRQNGRDGNRLGGSVGAQVPRTGERPRSAESTQRGATGRRDLDSGDVLPRRMSPLRRFKRRGLMLSRRLPSKRCKALHSGFTQAKRLWALA